MQKQSVFHSRLLPFLLLIPQLARRSGVLLLAGRPGLSGSRSCCRTRSVSPPPSSPSRTTPICSASRSIFATIIRTFVFSAAIAGASLSFALLLAVMARQAAAWRRHLSHAADLAVMPWRPLSPACCGSSCCIRRSVSWRAACATWASTGIPCSTAITP